MTPLLEVEQLTVHFRVGGLGRRRTVHAVDEVGFSLAPGETLGIVGESGCGKSTLARAICGLVPATSGQVRLQGEPLLGPARAARRRRERAVQLVFQDPLAALDPRLTVGQAVAEPLRTHEPGLSRLELRRRVDHILTLVGLSPALHNAYPHALSGGQCQRIGIARALILQPALLICDEPVSALDVSIQAQIVNLLQDLQDEFGLSMLFIAHDLSVVRHISRRVMVMYLGRAVEIASRQQLFATPAHPYTQALLAAVPVPDPARQRERLFAPVVGDLPSPLAPPPGCRFHTRCPYAAARCREQAPLLRPFGEGHAVACHFAEQIAAGERPAQPVEPARTAPV